MFALLARTKSGVPPVLVAIASRVVRPRILGVDPLDL